MEILLLATASLICGSAVVVPAVGAWARVREDRRRLTELGFSPNKLKIAKAN